MIQDRIYIGDCDCIWELGDVSDFRFGGGITGPKNHCDGCLEEILESENYWFSEQGNTKCGECMALDFKEMD